MVTLLAIALVVRQDPQPIYDGAREFANAIEAAAKEDPKFLDTIEPFATGYWIWRAETIKTFDGLFFAKEMLLCGNMITHWDAALGRKLREFALGALLDNPNRQVPAVLQADIRLAYVDRLSWNRGATDESAALFSAGARLADLTPHLAMAEFVELSEIRQSALESVTQCGKYADERPNGPATLKALLSAIGKMAEVLPFGVPTLRQVGMLEAQALASQVPEKFRWKIPPGSSGSL